MGPYGDIFARQHLYRHRPFSVGDGEKCLGLKMISMKFASFLSFSHLSSVTFTDFTAF